MPDLFSNPLFQAIFGLVILIGTWLYRDYRKEREAQHWRDLPEEIRQAEAQYDPPKK